MRLKFDFYGYLEHKLRLAKTDDDKVWLKLALDSCREFDTVIESKSSHHFNAATKLAEQRKQQRDEAAKLVSDAYWRLTEKDRSNSWVWRANKLSNDANLRGALGLQDADKRTGKPREIVHESKLRRYLKQYPGTG